MMTPAQTKKRLLESINRLKFEGDTSDTYRSAYNTALTAAAELVNIWLDDYDMPAAR
jgi:hypothetical protein